MAAVFEECDICDTTPHSSAGSITLNKTDDTVVFPDKLDHPHSNIKHGT